MRRRLPNPRDGLADLFGRTAMRTNRPGAPTPWSLLVPGLFQWARGHHRRGAILAGWYVSAMIAGLSATGSRIGWGLLGFAALVHVASAADAIELAAFPRLAVGPRGRWTAAGLAVGLGCYFPAILLGSWIGWPVLMARGPFEFQLVQRGAYRNATPDPGDRVWVTAHGEVAAGPATVVARPGERVYRANNSYIRPGQAPWRDPSSSPGRLVELEFRVPRGHLLVAFDPTPSGRPSQDPALVEISRVAGRIGGHVSEFPRQNPTDDRPRTSPNEPEVPA